LRRAAAEQRFDELRKVEEQLTTAHLETFAPAERPQLPAPQVVHLKPLQRRHLRAARKGVWPWQRTSWRTATVRGLRAANEEALTEKQRRADDYASRQAELDTAWDLLCANDPEVVFTVVSQAFDDNEFPAAPINVDGNQLAIAVFLPAVDFIPDQKAHITPTGRPSAKKRTKTERNELYLATVCSHVLATVQEALAVAPGVDTVLALAAAKSGSSLEPVLMTRLERSELSEWAHTNADAVDVVMADTDSRVNLKGRTKELAPLDLSDDRDAVEVVEAIRAAMSTLTP
jgi:hypothetical protein